MSSTTSKGSECGKHPGFRVGCYCGNEAKLDCRSMPGKKICDPSSDKFAYCMPAGKECGLGVLDACEGTSLVYCVDGFKTKTDCTALGFTACAPLSVNGVTLGAACQ